MGHIMDEMIRKENKEKGKKLCVRCNGTDVYNENFDYSQKD